MTSPIPTRVEPLAVTILSGQSLSAAVPLRGRTLVGVSLPSDWTTADLTFQGSLDGATFADVWAMTSAADGAEFLVKAAAGRAFPLWAADFAAFQAIRLRSGTSSAPVSQAAARVLTLALRDVG